MADMQKIADYLSECGVFYFATIDGDAPVVRPLGFCMARDEKLYLGVGTFKDVYKQIQANPHIYICALKQDGASWIRISAKAVIDNDPALVDACFELIPDMKPVYEENGWEMGIFHLEGGTITYVENVMQPAVTETF
ncbi:MAG: pyridoxamine 5'-phosphate oxidase family protein [Eggerthellaceae bacterium]|nr:pyridoxamine 5'-phosphate oxidase family protein [Eggerthellaceae bacterium]MBQ9068027.1 pyridoxamine 5'-phosphate oxidase family protein [Eggerthellaceae bacterium]